MNAVDDREREMLLKLYDRSILKQAKFEAIADLLPLTIGKRCLDIGGDNGVLSYLLRQRGGEWTSADLDADVVEAIRRMVGDNVYQIDDGVLPFPDGYFDVVVIIDFLEHIRNDEAFIRELYRVTHPGSVLIANVPHYKEHSPIRRLRLAVGLTDEKHGHVRPGYTLESLQNVLLPSFDIDKHGTYSRFFVELYDVAVSLFFDRAKNGKHSAKGNVVTGDELRKHEKKFRLFSLIYPLVWLFAQIDRALFFTSGYSLIARAHRSAQPAGRA